MNIALDTINIVGMCKNNNDEANAQLTLRNCEIFEERDHERESNLFSHSNNNQTGIGKRIDHPYS
jgi:hypothetical protein